jgi:peptidoglycan/xylan/chitin deacetylase (PgdA/CDA1 family)
VKNKLFLLLFLIILLAPLSTIHAANKSVPILMYHYIGNNPNPKDTARNTLSVAPDRFDTQLNYLSQNGYTPVSLNTLYAMYTGKAAYPTKPIVLTFDDGYIDFYHNAFPILSKYHFSAISFIPTGLMNQGYYMSWDQIKEIQKSGLVTFEAHSVSHSNMTLLSQAKLQQELSDSKKILTAQTGFPTNFIAYPMGLTNQVVQNAAIKAGFLGGLGTWEGKASGGSMNMPRIRITGQMDLKSFAAKL